MNKAREKELCMIFARYKENQKELRDKYSIPVPSGVNYRKIVVKTDVTKNAQEELAVEYAARRENLYKQITIVDEVMQWFALEGHGRERFIKVFFIDRALWVRAEMDCHVSRDTLSRWRRDVLEKAEIVGEWLNYFEKN